MTDRRRSLKDRRNPRHFFRIKKGDRYETVECGPTGSFFPCEDPSAVIPLDNPDNGGRRRDHATREWFDSINTWPTFVDSAAMGATDFPKNRCYAKGFCDGMRTALRRKEEK